MRRFLCFQDTIKLRGEVSFPNLHFEKTVVDFGCILNNTEATRYLNVTNSGPLEVSYRWSFVLDNKPVAIFRKPPRRSAGGSPTVKLESAEVREYTPQFPDEPNADVAKLEPEALDVTIERFADSPGSVDLVQVP